jgi:hypothetical protein
MDAVTAMKGCTTPRLGVTAGDHDAAPGGVVAPPERRNGVTMRIAMARDHAGWSLTEEITEILMSRRWRAQPLDLIT